MNYQTQAFNIFIIKSTFKARKSSSTPCKPEPINFRFLYCTQLNCEISHLCSTPLTKLAAQFVFEANQGTLVLQLLKIVLQFLVLQLHFQLPILFRYTFLKMNLPQHCTFASFLLSVVLAP